MGTLSPFMRLKVKRDTFFLPDTDNSVYFRNNQNSFRMEGSSIIQWVEKLMPMFNGEYSMEELTAGLSQAYRNRVYEIAEVLYRNGFVRDTSRELPHQLPDTILKKYAAQIEFLENFGDSGAYRFQIYRQAKVLAVGAGPFLLSLVSALLESGLPKFTVFITEDMPTNRKRLAELAEHARNMDPEVEVREFVKGKGEAGSWKEIVQPFDSTLYVSEKGNLEELRELHAACKEERKTFLPAIRLQHAGLGGPLVDPDSKGCWESAWRRIHELAINKDERSHTFSSTAGAVLANAITFELFKNVSGPVKPESYNQFYLLDLETLEGNWHPFLPHPLVTGRMAAKWIQMDDIWLNQKAEKRDASELLFFFSQLTSKEAGIFHLWEEGDLIQLPLSQCRVWAADPLSEGPSRRLPEMVCSGLTHEEARREAGLSGIEAYTSRLADVIDPSLPAHGAMSGPQKFFGIGAGETFAEGVARALQSYLTRKLDKRQDNNAEIRVIPVQISAMEDKRCRFYLKALTTMQGAPMIGLGEDIHGFPVVWVGTNGDWYKSAGLNRTIALQKALQQALLKGQNAPSSPTEETLSICVEERAPLALDIPVNEATESEMLLSAMEVLEENHSRLLVFELELEPFLKEKLKLFGVTIRKEDSR